MTPAPTPIPPAPAKPKRRLPPRGQGGRFISAAPAPLKQGPSARQRNAALSIMLALAFAFGAVAGALVTLASQPPALAFPFQPLKG